MLLLGAATPSKSLFYTCKNMAIHPLTVLITWLYIKVLLLNALEEIPSFDEERESINSLP
jgi:hypothetical protein